ncbi:hypothetical protein PRLR5067_19080 [Prevotella lacticifex]|nr:hypothetical protein PRLR5019_19280 [Prevotella lacticifex]GJG46310.1 hypothetical protein PRLR5027_19050 [Prevotella lacticifex]GJG55872.1 hypothetical protein PRLR5067_19080 [Prevotella lacticifex]GJG64921.1 hypothetical protein PRLR6014_13970 [Prevotella lacticifex]GJG67878.1 hypothetical protein PRLR6025_13470 [Prevotella lacticifex]
MKPFPALAQPRLWEKPPQLFFCIQLDLISLKAYNGISDREAKEAEYRARAKNIHGKSTSE